MRSLLVWSMIGIALAFAPQQGRAETRADFESGNGMLEFCSIESDWGQGLCMGRIEGLLAGLATSSVIGSPALVCVPKGVTNKQRLDVVVAYLRDHPDRRQTFWSVLALAALSEAWPCPSGFKMYYNPRIGKFDYNQPKQ